MNNPCPCGSGLTFRDCCNLIISAQNEALTCEQLMRSRYSAYTMANVDYLMLSQHTETRRVNESKEIRKWAKSVRWMGLVILKTEAGGAKDNHGYVEFRALYMEAGQMQQIHEKSLFKRENGKWVYDSGVHF